MIGVMAAALPLLAGAVIDVTEAGDLHAALDRARAGDVVRLAPGRYASALGRRHGPLRIEGAGLGRTEVTAPEGEDGLVVAGGEVALAGLALRAGPARSALKVLGGLARLEDVALLGGAAGLFVEEGKVEGRGVELGGDYGLLARGESVALVDGAARGSRAGIGVLRGRLDLRRFAVTGPSTEGGISVAGGEAFLEAVVVRAPGPSGLAIAGGAVVTGVDVDVAGAREVDGFLGDCVQVRRGTVRLEAGALVRCAGAAVEAAGGTLSLRGLDAAGGEAGCLVLVEGAQAELVGNVCVGHGPGLVAASGAHASLRANRWRTDPALWVDCGAGARVDVGRGERVKAPCQAPGQ